MIRFWFVFEMKPSNATILDEFICLMDRYNAFKETAQFEESIFMFWQFAIGIGYEPNFTEIALADLSVTTFMYRN